MKTLIEHGADPTLLSNLKTSILHAAAESKTDGGLRAALKIWKRCSDQLNINQTNKWAETPLHLASWSSASCVRLLLEAGADPSLQNEDGQVALHCAGLSEHGLERREIASLLCNAENKSHVNTQDSDGRPPIFDYLDDAECVEVLIRHGARLDLRDDLGRTIFHHACIEGENETLSRILGLCDECDVVVARSDNRNTPLMDALSVPNVECAMALLKLDNIGDTVGKDGWAPVHYAAKIGDVDLLEAVLKHSSFRKGVTTLDGKRASVIAMEAGTWHGEVKDLIREHDYHGWVD